MSSELGNRLRQICQVTQPWASAEMKRVLVRFEEEMVKLIKADDATVVGREVALRRASAVLPPSGQRPPRPKSVAAPASWNSGGPSGCIFLGAKEWYDNAVAESERAVGGRHRRA